MVRLHARVGASIAFALLAACSSGGAKTETVAVCKGASVACGDGCVDVRSDNQNCGACGTVCGGGDVCVAGACAAHPAITSFTGPLAFTAGSAGLTLDATFTNGTAAVAGCSPASASTSPATFTCPALAADTTFTLAVTSSALAGVVDTATLTVAAVAAPVATALVASPGAVTAGDGGPVTLTAMYASATSATVSGSDGSGPLAVASGVPARLPGPSGAAAGTTVTYTLAVANAAGTVATHAAQVQVVAAPSIQSGSLQVAPSALTVGDAGAVTFTAPTFATANGAFASAVLSGGPSSGAAAIPSGGTNGTYVRAQDFLAAGTYLFTVTAANGATTPATAQATTSVRVYDPPAVASGTLTASPTAVAAGGSATVTAPVFGPSVTSAFLSTLASGATSGAAITSGGQVVFPGLATSTTWYLYVVNGAGKLVQAPGQAVTVTVPLSPTFTAGTFSASPMFVPLASAGTVTFSVPTFGPSVATATITGGGASVAATSGGSPTLPAPRATTRYGLTASNAAGQTVSQTASVLVAEPIPGPDLSSVRYGAASVVLPGGKILLVGGSTIVDSLPNATTTAVVYDPATGTFGPPISMISARYLPTATLLTGGLYSGKVLVAGGCASNGVELYDPGSNSFFAASNLRWMRCGGHAAFEVTPGTVAIAGGDDCGGTDRSQIEYWTDGNPTAIGVPLTTPRRGLTATKLTNGKVLLAGGSLSASWADLLTINAFSPSSSAVARVYTATGTARQNPTATLLTDGTVLVAGGTTSATGTAEVYDPATNTFAATSGEMYVPRARHAATLLASGVVLLLGGTTGSGPIRIVEWYDPATRRFGIGPNLLTNRTQLVTAPVAGDVTLVAGGTDGTGLTSPTELFISP
jgi:hypothetical protein